MPFSIVIFTLNRFIQNINDQLCSIFTAEITAVLTEFSMIISKHFKNIHV